MDVTTPLYANLLPDLLVALVGLPGDVFVPTSSQNGPTNFRLSDIIDWVSPADREVLDTLCRLGALYADLNASLEPAGAGGSLYTRALANGISELLEVYRQAVLQVEQHLLHSPVPPLLTLQQFLADFQVLFPEVHTLVAEVHGRGGMPGSRIMQLLAAKARSGQPAVQSCAQRLLWHCYQVVFKQLESWLVHGLLLDSAGEFFIQPSAALGEASEAQLRQASPSPVRPAFGTGLSPPQDWDPLEWHSGFEVSVSALPPGISLSSADAILFIGKAVRVLKQPVVAAAGAGPGQALQASSEMLGFCEELHKLQQREEFRPADFDSLVDRMRRSVAGLLWTLVLHRSDLLGNLTSLRNYSLMGRGDFFQQFLDEAQPLLQAPPKSSTAEVDIGLVFQQASLKSTADVDPLFSHWHLRWADPAAGAAAAASAAAAAGPQGEAAAAAPAPEIEAATRAELLLALPPWHPSHTANVAVPALDLWDGLYLESVVDWPLQLLFPPEVLSKYGAVWQYLFRLRRVQLSLEGAWSTMQALQHPSAAAADGPRLSPALRSQLWQLRHRMAHFIHNLEMYIQVDVIDSRFAQLHEAILHAQDFMAADAAHRDYVDSLVIQTFLDLKQLMQIVEAIFDACVRLSKLVQGLASGQTSEADAQPLVRQVGDSFRVRITMLSTLLQSNKLQSANRAPALRQLLLRLNYNNFNSAGVLFAALKPV